MIKKKICLLGSFAVGKTSLVQRFVNSIFSEKYLTTIGVKIDQKNNLGFVKLNDSLINIFQLRGEKWDALFAKSKFSKSDEYPYLGDKRWYDFGKFSKGYICFQDHPGKAYFKNIRIRELD